MRRGRTTRALSFHARYGCRSSGACCTSNWPIPAEQPIELRVRRALADGSLRLPRPHAGPAIGPDGLLSTDAHGACVFFDAAAGRLCAIQRALGPDALPAACRHFPRVARIERGRVSVTLSHYCPTAAALLFEEGPTAIVDDPPAFPAEREYEGLDVSDALPPLLRPGVLMSPEAWSAFEAHAVSTLTRPDLTPEEAVGTLATQADEAARWTPARGPLDDWVAGALAGTKSWPLGDPRELFRLAASCVPAGVAAPSLPGASPVSDWRGFEPVVGRYLAAKAFASWCAYQGNGLRTTVRAIEAALAVLRLEARRAGKALDAPALKEAVRRSDLLLVHLAAPETMARRLGAAPGS